MMIKKFCGSIEGYKYNVEEKWPEGRSYFFTFKSETPKRETLTIDLYKVINDDSNELIDLWYKRGHIKTKLASYWHITVYATDQDGFTWGRYNPQLQPGSTKINFDWILEATPENRNKLLKEVIRRAYK